MSKIVTGNVLIPLVTKKMLAYGRDLVVQNRVFIPHIVGLFLRSIICPIPDSFLVLPHYLKSIFLLLQEESTVCEALGSVIRLAVTHRMVGEVYTSMGQYAKALKHQMKHLGMIFEF